MRRHFIIVQCVTFTETHLMQSGYLTDSSTIRLKSKVWVWYCLFGVPACCLAAVMIFAGRVDGRDQEHQSGVDIWAGGLGVFDSLWAPSRQEQQHHGHCTNQITPTHSGQIWKLVRTPWHRFLKCPYFAIIWRIPNFVLEVSYNMFTCREMHRYFER